MPEPVLLRGPKGQFLPGTGSPGRSPGARTKFSQAFLEDFQEDWRAHGATVMAQVRKEDPVAYLRIAAGLAAHLAPKPRPEPFEPPDMSALFGAPALPRPGEMQTPPEGDPLFTRYMNECELLRPRRPGDLSLQELKDLWPRDVFEHYLDRRLKEACEKLLPRKPEDLSEQELRQVLGDELVDYFFEPNDPDPLATRLAQAIERLEPERPSDLSDAELDAAWGEELAAYWRDKVRRVPAAEGGA